MHTFKTLYLVLVSFTRGVDSWGNPVAFLAAISIVDVSVTIYGGLLYNCYIRQVEKCVLIASFTNLCMLQSICETSHYA